MRHVFRLCFGVTLAALFAAMASAAQPTPHDIQAAIQSGHFAQADRAIAQVLAAHPDSAKAHYADAQLLADEGKWPLAQAELNRAEHLDSAMGFVRPDVLTAFTRQVQEHTQGAAAPSASPGFLLGAMAFVLIFVYLVAEMFRARTRPIVMPPAGMPPGATPMGTTIDPPEGPAAPPAGGSGLLGALGTGLAAGAGFAAGEALVDKLLESGHKAMDSSSGMDIPPVDSIPNDQDVGSTDANDWSDDSADAGTGDSWSDT
ncbi:hypothetical protein GALL_490990 [mine drainage metagenome]|uniref:Tetratricopeptide repeat protein n=1 Tax=mine drainage metagenome TaxID=410659 RepID=A0A1J5Q0C2_9ZZZZ